MNLNKYKFVNEQTLRNVLNLNTLYSIWYTFVINLFYYLLARNALISRWRITFGGQRFVINFFNSFNDYYRWLANDKFVSGSAVLKSVREYRSRGIETIIAVPKRDVREIFNSAFSPKRVGGARHAKRYVMQITTRHNIYIYISEYKKNCRVRNFGTYEKRAQSNKLDRN